VCVCVCSNNTDDVDVRGNHEACDPFWAGKGRKPKRGKKKSD